MSGKPVGAVRGRQSRQDVGLLDRARSGFAYETPFRFNPLTGKFIPWLATGGTGRTKTTYVMNIRRGSSSVDGKTLTPKDVKYSFDLLKIPTHPQNALWATPGCKSVKAVGNNVVFTFAGKPGLPAVRLLPLQRRDRPAARLQEVQQDGPHDRQPGGHDKVVGTGPYAYQSGVRARRRRRSSGSDAATGGRRRRSVSGRRRDTSSTSTTRRTRRRSPTSRRGTSTSSTTSHRSRRSRASSRPTSTRPRTTWARTRRGSSRTRRRSR